MDNSRKASLDHVVLQLSWTHGMRFAGYYLAQEQGFYREAGFDVEIRERRPNVSPIELVVSGDADYGVSSSLLVFHVYGLPVMVLAAMAQHSPFVVLAPERSGIHDLRDFRGKKIMMGSSLMIYEVQVMLASIGISPGEVEIVPHTADIDLFLSGYADACLTFIGSFSHELERRGIPYVAFDPRDYGADSYGEMLFTSRRQALKNPSRVKAFRDASQKGWAWFASHTDEAIQLVAQYVPDAGPEKLASDARVMRELLIDDMVPLGYINTERWVANGKRLAQISQLPYAEEQSRAMLFADYLDGRSLRRNRNLRYGFCVVFGLMVFLGVVALLLRRAVRRRTSELALANHNLNQENAALDQAEKHLCLQRDFAAALVNVKTLSECYRRAVAFMMKIPEVNCCGILVVDASNELLTVKVIQGVDGYLAD